jgi:hypothetical protein
MGIRRLKNRKQIVLRFTDAAKCHDEKDVVGAGDFKSGNLRLSWINEKVLIDRDVQANVKDVDRDEEEEMIFAEDK